jgi:hypothetical protein
MKAGVVTGLVCLITALFLVLPAFVIDAAARDDPEITLDIVNYYLIPDVWQVLGMDYDEAGDRLYFCSNVDNKVFICRASDGHLIDNIDITFRENPSPFGVCYNPASGYLYVNDWIEDPLYEYSGGEWTALDDPAGREGRGLDLDLSGEYVYETYDDLGFYKFKPDGGDAYYFEVPGLQSRTSGLTCFPYLGGEAVALDTYEDPYINFYKITGETAVPRGSVRIPQSNFFYSLGLAYADARGTFFWSCWDIHDVYWVYEFDIDFEFASIEPTSLGRMKAMYR